MRVAEGMSPRRSLLLALLLPGCLAPVGLESSSSRADEDLDAKVCCVCQYLRNEDCEAAPEGDWCEHGPGQFEHAGVTYTDCVWRDGRCTTRHEIDCDDWIAAQEGCDETAKVRVAAEQEDPTGGLEDCTDFRYRYAGHGQGCQFVENTAIVCIGRQPQCSSFDFDIGGCQTFRDLEAARAAAERIQRELGGAQCATISAHQCESSTGCPSYYTFSIVQDGICETAGDCNPAGAHCFTHDQSSRCTGADGDETTQVCCCDPPESAECTWRPDAESCDGSPRTEEYCCVEASAWDDPCHWSGDGRCQRGCQWGDDPDCPAAPDPGEPEDPEDPDDGGVPQTLEYCCVEGSAWDDPCGWSGDGVCDEGCQWGDDPDCQDDGGDDVDPEVECADACAWGCDGICDYDDGLCDEGTDYEDCGY